MADMEVSDLTALTGANLASGDLAHIVDVSDTTMSAEGTDKKMTAAELAIGLQRLTVPWDSELLGGTSTSIDFSSIPGTAKHIRMICVMRSDRSGQITDGVNIGFNGDTTATNYEWQRGQDTSTTPSALYTNDARNIAKVPGATATANQFGIFEVLIPMYANTVSTKVAQATGVSCDTAGSVITTFHYGCHWQSTAAITQVTLTPVNGPNFIAGTSVDVYLEY